MSHDWLPILGSVLTLAFGAWAGVVVWGVKAIVGEVRDIRVDTSHFRAEFQDYVLKMERRVTALEEYEKTQDARAQDHYDAMLRRTKETA